MLVGREGGREGKDGGARGGRGRTEERIPGVSGRTPLRSRASAAVRFLRGVAPRWPPAAPAPQRPPVEAVLMLMPNERGIAMA